MDKKSRKDIATDAELSCSTGAEETIVPPRTVKNKEEWGGIRSPDMSTHYEIVICVPEVCSLSRQYVFKSYKMFE